MNKDWMFLVIIALFIVLYIYDSFTINGLEQERDMAIEQKEWIKQVLLKERRENQW